MVPVPDFTSEKTTSLASAPSLNAASALQRILAFGFDLALLHGAAKFLSEWISLSFLRILLAPSTSSVSPAKLVSSQTFQNAFTYANYYLYLPTLLFLSFVYYLIFLHLWGTSFGKSLIGIAVVDRLGNLPTADQVVKRYLATVFNSLTCGFLFIVGLYSRRRLCLQDEVSGTFVIKRPFHFALVRRAATPASDSVVPKPFAAKIVASPLLLPLLPKPPVETSSKPDSATVGKPNAA